MGGKYCRYEAQATRIPNKDPEITSNGWCLASMMRDMAIKAAPSEGAMTIKVFQTSPRLSRIWNLPAR
jgi:hypothetical protein